MAKCRHGICLMVDAQHCPLMGTEKRQALHHHGKTVLHSWIQAIESSTQESLQLAE